MKELIEDTLTYIEQTYGVSPACPIVIVHGQEEPAELQLLEKLASSLTEKVATCQLLSTDQPIGPAKLLLVTDNAAPHVQATGQTLRLSRLSQYIQEPKRRRQLWDQIVQSMPR